MAKEIIFIVFIAIIILPVFPIHANASDEVFNPNEAGPYHVGYYKVRYNDPVYGFYTAT